jgi:formylglycine-generating enzyme required for sulfatase activity
MAAQGDLGRTLTPERWRQIERLFGGALEQPAEDRSAWLTATVDPDLRGEILSLLAAHEKAEGLLDRPCPAPLPPESPLSPGQRLGPYEIVAPLASGGMGYVFRAHDARLGRDVALKLLAPRLASRPQSLRRFEREARAVAALSHPNIVALHDVGREGGHAFVVLELLRGESLRSRLGRGPLSVPEALRLARDVARGLGAAHARGLVHRDLKPDNVWLCASGPAKVLDFGIARFATEPPTPFPLDVPENGGPPDAAGLGPSPGTAGGILGTVGYLSPEQARGEPADARSDVFAFGCVLYECLTGRGAFDAGDAAKAVHSVLRDEPPPVRQGHAEVPRALAAIVERCLQKDPARRFASGADLAAAIEPLAAEAEVAAHRRGWWRRPAVLAATAAGLLAATASGYRAWRARDVEPATAGGLVFRRNVTDGALYSRIPPGTFGMGCDPNLASRPALPCDTRSQPFFHVTIARPYWVMRTEVTQAQFAAYARATAAEMPGPGRVGALPARMAALREALFTRPDYPVVEVNWHEASAYCAWTGGRLPSEAEWERAARANHEWDFVWGVANLGVGSLPLANVRDESRFRKYGPHVTDTGAEWPEARYIGYDDGFPDLAPVASFPPNDFGLYDMGGNVWEWTLDDGPAAFQVPSYVGHPTDGSPRHGWSGQFHVIRGSGWDFGPTAQAVWIRDVGSALGHGYMLGFRCVRGTPP